MKKNILFLTLMIASLSYITALTAQTDNSWVLPFFNTNYNADRIEFTDPIEAYTIQSGITGSPYRFSAGGYDANGNLLFYMLDFEVYAYHNGVSSSVGSIEPLSSSPAPEVQIIKKPGVDYHYYIIYSLTGAGGNQNHQFYFVEVTVNQDPYDVVLSDKQFINTCNEPEWGGFAVTREINGKSKLFTCSVCGIMETVIDENGFSDTPVLILSSDDAIIGNSNNFYASNFEMKANNNCDTLFAWFTKDPSSSDRDKVFIYNRQTGVAKKIDVDLGTNGSVSGIEFSTFEDDVIYISYSCTDNSNYSGIYKMNYETGTSVLMEPGEQYGHTFLQLAPDGDIYGVTKGASQSESDVFFKINMDNGGFTANAYDNGLVLSYLGEYADRNFILPEKTMVFETLNFTVQTDDIACECPDEYAYGSAEVTGVQGGCGTVEPYYYTWYDAGGNILLEGEDEDYLDNLPEGTYTVCVSDAGIPPVTGCQTFNITLDEALYTYDNMVHIWPGTPDWNNLTVDKFREGIFVHQDADFTINNSYLQFGPDAKIIVETGAVLRVDNTTLTYVQQCPCPWQGIEVWGNRNMHQYTINGICYQGKLYLEDAVIEHAWNAVALWKPGDYETTGGIVYAKSTEFKNNKRTAEFMKYQNYAPGSNSLVTYFSWFKDCDFFVDDSYLIPAEFNAHVTAWSVNGIKFEGCRFANRITGAENTGYGIYGSDAGFQVYDYCTDPYVSPCPPENTVQSTFNNFYTAVKAANTTESKNTIYVGNTVFTNNSYGIKLDKVGNASILFSKFYIGPNTQDQSICGDDVASYGIDMNECSGFAVEENEFYKYTGAPQGIYTGIRIAETQSKDEVYKNSFEGLSYGNYALGKNWGKYSSEGLAYYCNENTGNWQDFTVEDVPDQIDGIQDPQGSTELPAGNTFSANANFNFNNWDFNDWIGYYFYAPSPGNTNTVYYPEFVNRVTREEVVGIQNQCPSHYGGGGGGGVGIRAVLASEEQQQAEQDFADNLANYNNVKTLYENLKDGGDADGTVSDVETAWPDEMWELRAELLAKSPHLSFEVLKSVADRTDVFPDEVIFEIMAANPDELRKNELMTYLETKEHPLPDYMIQVLRQILSTGSTYKTILISDMAHYSRLMTRAANDMLRSILNDSVTDYAALHTWLDNLGGKRADEQLIAAYLKEGNYDQALALASSLPGTYNYNENEQAEHTYYMDMLNLQIELSQQERTIFDLDTTEVNELLYVAENSNGTAGAIARGILEFAYGYHYCDCLNADTTGYKSGSVFNPGDYAEALGLTVTAQPNPAKRWVAFNYKLPAVDSKATIKITDVSGKLITAFSVSGKQGQKIWDTRKIKSGVYFYTLNVSGFNKSGKIVISK